MKAIERVYQYIDYKGIKPTRFEKEIGLSNGYLGTQLRRKADLGESIMNKIIDNCLDLNPEWLLAGRGQMLIKEQSIDELVIKKMEALMAGAVGDFEKKFAHIYEQIDLLGLTIAQIEINNVEREMKDEKKEEQEKESSV